MLSEIQTVRHHGIVSQLHFHVTNPAEREVDRKLYHDGYHELLIVSDGTNPYFKKAIQRILFVRTKCDSVQRYLNDDNLHVIPVEPRTQIGTPTFSFGRMTRDKEHIHCSVVSVPLSLDGTALNPFYFIWNIVDLSDFFPQQ